MPISNSNNQPLNLPGTFAKHRARSIFALMAGSISLICHSTQLIAADNGKAEVKTSLTVTHQPKLQSTVWWKIARRHQIDPYILYAVALTESRKNDDQNRLIPSPWAINNAGNAFHPDSYQEAEALLNQLIDQGKRNIDVGMMQVNLRWHGNRVAKPEQLLIPSTNLEIGASVLSEAIQSVPGNLAHGIGRYYSWKNEPAAIQYGQKVIALADQIRAIL